MLKRLVFTSIIVVSLLITGCGNQTPAGPAKMKIAVSVPLKEDFGQDNLHAVQLALEKAGNKAGPYELELVVFDENDPVDGSISVEQVRKNAEEAVKDPSIVGWIGPDGSRSAKEIIPILNQASVAQISATNTWPGLTKVGYGPGEPGMYYPTGKQNYFRTVSSDEVQGAAAARWIRDLGYKNVYVLYASDVYGTGIAGIFDLAAKDLGLTVLGKETFEASTPLSPEATQALANKALNTEPDVVYVAGGVGSNAENVVRALRETNPTLPIMGPDGLAVDDLVSILGAEIAANIYGTTVTIPVELLETPAALDFIQSYQSAYGKTPTSFDAAIYESASVMITAIGRAKEPTRMAVLDALLSLGEYNGVLGTWHFDENGDISLSNISGLQVQNGTWVFVKALK